MENMQDLNALLRHEIEDLISAEDQLLEGMPMMIEAARNSQLKAALREHLRVTRTQRKRLDKVQKLLGAANKADNGESQGLFNKLFGSVTKHECKGMKGIIEEGNKVLSADMSAAVKDAAIIASAQKQEHYEICGYGTARAFARELNMTEIANLLEETLNEEYQADRLLTQMAESDINEKAEGKSKSRSGQLKAAANKGGSNNATGNSRSGSASGAKVAAKAAGKQTGNVSAKKVATKGSSAASPSKALRRR